MVKDLTVLGTIAAIVGSIAYCGYLEGEKRELRERMQIEIPKENTDSHLYTRDVIVRGKPYVMVTAYGKHGFELIPK